MRILSISIALAAGFALAGCGDNSPAAIPDGAPADSMPDDIDGMSVAPITGTSIVTHVTATGEVDVATDLSQATIAALVSDGGGGYTTYPGTGNADGTFSIPNVPADTTYLLQLDNTYVVTDRREIDLGYVVVGRPNVEYASTSPTNATFDVDAMNPWSPGDGLTFSSPNAGTVLYALLPDPAEGATKLDVTVDYAAAVLAGLIDSTQGDIAYISHSSGEIDASGAFIQTLEQVATFADIQQHDGEATTFAGTFEDVTKDQSVDLDIRFSQFLDQVDGTLPGGAAGIVAQPGTSDHGAFGFGAGELVDVGHDQDTTATVSYGNPFPESWSLYGDVFVSADAAITTIAGDEVFALEVAAYNDTLAGFADGPIEPIVSPISAPTLDGRELTQPIDDVSDAPTVAWNASPDADGYVVTLFRITEATSGDLFGLPEAYFFTTGTEVTVPPGILGGGGAYYLQISAYAHPNTDFEASPFRESFPFGQADHVTQTFRVLLTDVAPPREAAPARAFQRIRDPRRLVGKPHPTF